MELSYDQEAAIEYVAQWLSGTTPPIYTQETRNGRLRSITVGTSHDYPVCSVGGYAGTGKTTIIRVLAEDTPRAVLVTPTHKAAQVLRGKLPPPLAARVQTFHSLIYTPDPKFTCDYTGSPMSIVDCGCLPDEDCECEAKLDPCQYHAAIPEGWDGALCEPKETLKFVKREHLTGLYSLIIVDEASMLTEQEVNDLRSYGLPVLLVGDHGQLPPVKAKMNPWIANPRVTLTVNHRQGEASGIPDAAESARVRGALVRSSYGTSVRVLPASSTETELLLARFVPDAKHATVLVQYNKTRAMLNQMFHAQGHGPVCGGNYCVREGERIISLERQEEVQELDADGSVINETLIHNGTLATVTRVLSTGPRYHLIQAKLDIDWRGNTDTEVLLKVATEQFGRPDQLNYRTKPRGAALWDYAYALTAHKAQGSEFDNVIVWQETPGDKRWLYTACTRARQALVVLVLCRCIDLTRAKNALIVLT